MKLNKIENILKSIYNPKVDKTKRKKLLKISIYILAINLVVSFLQYIFHWTNDSIYLLTIVLSLISIIGILVSKYANDFLVALVYGNKF